MDGGMPHKHTLCFHSMLAGVCVMMVALAGFGCQKTLWCRQDPCQPASSTAPDAERSAARFGAHHRACVRLRWSVDWLASRLPNFGRPPAPIFVLSFFLLCNQDYYYIYRCVCSSSSSSGECASGWVDWDDAVAHTGNNMSVSHSLRMHACMHGPPYLLVVSLCR